MPQNTNAQIDTLALNLLKKQIDTLEKSDLMASGFVGFSLKVCKSSQKLIETNANKSLSPASTLKLITTATALLNLGADYKYTTTFGYDGSITNEMLNGNIIIKGSGDPSLGSHRFNKDQFYFLKDWAMALKALGISTISGKILMDNQYFEQNPTPSRWLWGDMGNYYGAGASGINFRENFFTTSITGAKTQNQTAIINKIIPDISPVSVVNEIVTDAPNTGDQVYIYSKPFDNQVLFTGFAPKNQTIYVKGTLPNPSLELGKELLKTLKEFGISFTKDTLGTTKGELIETNSKTNLNFDKVAETQSPALSELILKCNYHSINLYAEALLKTIAVKNGKGNTNEKATKELIDFWKRSGLNTDGFSPKDGSGLSPQDFVSPNFMTEVLSFMSNHKDFQTYLSSIPVVGESGTVKNLAKNSSAKGNIYAKSGSIEGARAYAGYFYAKSGELIAFSMMLNNYAKSGKNAGKELEKLLILMANL